MICNDDKDSAMFSILTLINHTAEKFDDPQIPATELTHQAAETTGVIARLIMEIVEWVLSKLGLGHHETLVIWIYSLLVFLIAYAIGSVTKWIVLGVVRSVGKRASNNGVYEMLRAEKFFSKACRIIPPIVFLIFIEFTLNAHATLSTFLMRITWIYIIFVLAIAINTVVYVTWRRIDERHNQRKLPLRGLVQLVKGIVWIIAAIVILAIIFDKSPASLLAGLGAFAAVLMLVFKDSILGVVAGVQLSENDSLHVGDWIKVNGTDANGTVTEVTLTQVKIENFDKTIVTLPPYQLISGSFTNYRPMQESNTRRIMRSYQIDADSVVPTTPEWLEAMKKIPFMDNYITRKQAQAAAGKVQNVENSEGLVDGSIETNLGLFRAYLKMWLDANDMIDKNSTCFVTTLAQTVYGIPLQVYCFTTTSSWLPYEGIQACVFEHIAVMLARFGLYTNEQASGRDSIIEGYIEANKPISDVFGTPYPFFHGPDYPYSPVAPAEAKPQPAPAPAAPAQSAAPAASTGSTE